MRRLLFLAGGSLVFWALVALPIRALSHDPTIAFRAIAYWSTALLLCTIPTGVTLYLADRSFGQSPEQMMLAVFGGTGIRMFTVLLAGWLLFQMAPFYQQTSFWIWLVAAYLFTLALEVTLLLVGRTAPESKS